MKMTIIIEGALIPMANFVKLNPSELKALRTVDERLVSYNVEMT